MPSLPPNHPGTPPELLQQQQPLSQATTEAFQQAGAAATEAVAAVSAITGIIQAPVADVSGKLTLDQAISPGTAMDGVAEVVIESYHPTVPGRSAGTDGAQSIGDGLFRVVAGTKIPSQEGAWEASKAEKHRKGRLGQTHVVPAAKQLLAAYADTCMSDWGSPASLATCSWAALQDLTQSQFPGMLSGVAPACVTQKQDQMQHAIRPFRSSALDSMRELKTTAKRAARRPSHCRNAGDLMYPESAVMDQEDDLVEELIGQA